MLVVGAWIAFAAYMYITVGKDDALAHLQKQARRIAKAVCLEVPDFILQNCRGT